MFKPMVFSLVALATVFATSAEAAEYEVLLLGGGFFPETTYLNDGDVVTFSNVSEEIAEVKSKTEGWTTGQLSANESFVLVVTADTVLEFTYAEAGESGNDDGSEETSENDSAEGDDENSAASGSFSFEPAPSN